MISIYQSIYRRNCPPEKMKIGEHERADYLAKKISISMSPLGRWIVLKWKLNIFQSPKLRVINRRRIARNKLAYPQFLPNALSNYYQSLNSLNNNRTWHTLKSHRFGGFWRNWNVIYLRILFGTPYIVDVHNCPINFFQSHSDRLTGEMDRITRLARQINVETKKEWEGKNTNNTADCQSVWSAACELIQFVSHSTCPRTTGNSRAEKNESHSIEWMEWHRHRQLKSDRR